MNLEYSAKTFHEMQFDEQLFVSTLKLIIICFVSQFKQKYFVVF